MHKSISCSWLLRREGFICVGLVMCVCVCARVFSSMTIWKLPQMRDRIRPLLYGRFVLNLSLLGGPFPTPLSPVSHQQTTYLKLWKGKVKNQDDSLRKWNKPREKKKKGHRATPQTGLGSLKLRKKHLISSSQLGEHTDYGGKAVGGWFTLFY